MQGALAFARLRRAVVFGVCVIAAWSASVTRAGAAVDVEILPDRIYGHKDGMALTLDVFRPKTGASGAAVLYMVSGGWVSRWTDPKESLERYQFLLDKGYTVVAIRHGSSPKYFVPEAVADVRRAVRFVRYHAKEWGIDPDRIGVHGGSAGGHLSLMIGLGSDAPDPGAEEPFMRESNRVASVVAYYPPVDLRTWARGPIAVQPGQRFPALNFEREKAPGISPILYVTADDPPTLLIHGDKDTTVPINHSERLIQALKDTGITSDFITIPGAGHGFRDADLDRARTALLAWFDRTLAKKK